jgi:hypothetical protein
MKRISLFEVNGSITVKGKPVDVTGYALVYSGTRKADTPKTYKEVGVLRHNKGNDFNPDILTVFKTTTGEYRYSMYRDGGFFPVVGVIKFIKLVNTFVGNVAKVYAAHIMDVLKKSDYVNDNKIELYGHGDYTNSSIYAVCNNEQLLALRDIIAKLCGEK